MTPKGSKDNKDNKQREKNTLENKENMAQATDPIRTNLRKTERPKRSEKHVQ
jgi:hypothetical protein